jgi:anti-sigma B factor antagonist/stage II sporulation protein AA (anti-sigma F factor antagonist)
MNSIHRILRNGVAIERVDLVRATINDAVEIKENLLDDINFDKIIVDLSTCNYVDSTFFGALVFAYKILKQQGCAMVLVISKTFLARSYIYKQIASVFKVYLSISEALEALNFNYVKNSNYNYISAERRKEPVRIVQLPLQLDIE